MGISEANAFAGETVNVRGRNLAALRVIALYIAVAEVVSQQNDDIGFA